MLCTSNMIADGILQWLWAPRLNNIWWLAEENLSWFENWLPVQTCTITHLTVSEIEFKNRGFIYMHKTKTVSCTLPKELFANKFFVQPYIILYLGGPSKVSENGLHLQKCLTSHLSVPDKLFEHGRISQKPTSVTHSRPGNGSSLSEGGGCMVSDQFYVQQSQDMWWLQLELSPVSREYWSLKEIFYSRYDQEPCFFGGLWYTPPYLGWSIQEPLHLQEPAKRVPERKTDLIWIKLSGTWKELDNLTKPCEYPECLIRKVFTLIDPSEAMQSSV